MVFHYFERLFNALPDSDRRNDNNKLAPAVFFVQLEHSLYVTISFARTRFHFDIKRTAASVSERFGKLGRLLDIVI